jgi:peptide/nickel transport system permease protein
LSSSFSDRIITFTGAFHSGDPVRLILGPRAPQDVIDAVREQYGLNQPLINQYFIYIGNLFQGDWGTSISFKTPVLDLIIMRFPPTLYLLFGGLIFSIIPTLILSILASAKPDGWLDQLIRLFYTVGLGLPSFWLAIVLVLVFAVRLGWVPATGFGDTFTDHIRHMILPWVAAVYCHHLILTSNLRATLLKNKLISLWQVI